MPEPERPLDRLLAVPNDGLRIRDWLALGLLAVTAILAIGSIVALSIELHSVRTVSVDVAGWLLGGSLLAGICGLPVGYWAQATAHGRPRWPGVLALFSPVIAILGGMVFVHNLGPVVFVSTVWTASSGV